MSKKPINFKAHVIFSAVGTPSAYCVFDSLKKLDATTSATVITSHKYLEEWKKVGVKAIQAKYDSLAYSKKIFRKFLLRSRLLRVATTNILKFMGNSERAFLMPPHNARHFEYLRVLKTLPKDDWAFLVDSRDLIFQTHPTEIINKLSFGKPIHVFDEGEYFFKDGKSQTNLISPANWMWAKQLRNLNESDLNHLANENILNSGCIIGKVEALRNLMTESCDLLASSHWSNFALLDQASLNYAAYSSKFKGIVDFHKNGLPVLNMCGVISDSWVLKDGQFYINGSLASIVHQFDRFGTWTEKEGLTFSKRHYRVQ